MGCISISRALLLRWTDIIEDRASAHPHRHLPKSTKEVPQPIDAVCPSANDFAYQCPCIESGVASRFRVQEGANLIVVPSNLMSNWADEVVLNLDLKDSIFDWQVRTAHSQRYPPHAVFDSTKDAEAVQFEKTKSVHPLTKKEVPVLKGRPGQSRYVFLTTPVCYQTRIQDQMYVWVQPPVPPGRKRLPPRRKEPLRLTFARATRDEGHQEHNQYAKTISTFRALHGSAYRWILTGTAYEGTPGHLAYWVEGIQQAWQTHARNPKQWLKDARINLPKCSVGKILDLGKEYRRLVNKKDDTVAVRHHARQLQVVLKQLVIRRESEGKSRWFEEPLVDLPPHSRVIGRAYLTPEQAATINSETQRVASGLAEDLKKSLEAWESNGKCGIMPTTNTMNYLTLNRRVRIFTSLPGLAEVADRHKLELTAEEIEEKGWIRLQPDKLYELMPVPDCPYETQLLDIVRDSPKIKLLEQIRHEQRVGEALIVVTVWPVNALILYWVSIYNVSCASMLPTITNPLLAYPEVLEKCHRSSGACRAQRQTSS